jgi:DNA-binding transcriptional MerR regulator
MSIRIGEAASLLGVPASTLRYYEDIQLIRPTDRRRNGYRAFDADDLARLRFITSAKSVGIPLEQIRVLADAYELDDCSTVAHQVVESVASRLAESRTKIAELNVMATELESVITRLRAAPTAGPCGGTCPCGALPH